MIPADRLIKGMMTLTSTLSTPHMHQTGKNSDLGRGPIATTDQTLAEESLHGPIRAVYS